MISENAYCFKLKRRFHSDRTKEQFNHETYRSEFSRSDGEQRFACSKIQNTQRKNTFSFHSFKIFSLYFCYIFFDFVPSYTYLLLYIYIYSSYYCFKVIQLYRFSFISLRFLFWNHVLFSFRICLSIFVFLLNCVNNIIVILSQFFIPICW